VYASSLSRDSWFLSPCTVLRQVARTNVAATVNVRQRTYATAMLAGLTTLTAPAVRPIVKTNRDPLSLGISMSAPAAGICPNATAWADKASTHGTGHSEMECGNVGICNRNDAKRLRA